MAAACRNRGSGIERAGCIAATRGNIVGELLHHSMSSVSDTTDVTPDASAARNHARGDRRSARSATRRCRRIHPSARASRTDRESGTSRSTLQRWPLPAAPRDRQQHFRDAVQPPVPAVEGAPWTNECASNRPSKPRRIAQSRYPIGRLALGRSPRCRSASFLTGGGHVYPFYPIDLRSFMATCHANEIAKTTGFPGNIKKEADEGGERGIYTQK